ncbi:MAG TPA: Nramp family divalent metal transporter, partial [Holophaga sp.]|nr:Nramp family divalent metal transporter [Holophaga sp.]
MKWLNQLHEHWRLRRPLAGVWNPLQYLGPGLLVTVGFIDPGNWASNLAAGSQFGYQLLWVVTLGTGMLMILQHNAAHLGIVSGLCLSESASLHLPRWVSRPVLGTAVLAAMATAFAEIVGGAIALGMLFHLPLKLGATLTALVVGGLLLWNSYRRIEKLIVGFVSIIGLGFLFELFLVRVQWPQAMVGWVKPELPGGAMVLVMSVLGAVVMPHNLFLHSEFIQSRQWNSQGDEAIQSHLRFELFDTMSGMVAGWAINSAMIILAAAAFFQHGVLVDSLEQSEVMLRPILGSAAAVIFALALLCSGLASTITAGMAGGSIFAGIFGRPYDIQDGRSRVGVALTLVPAMVAAWLVTDSLKALIWSQVLLSIQLPLTVILQITMTSSREIMGRYANSAAGKALLWTVAG